MRRLKHVIFVLAAVFILLVGTAAPSRAIATDLLITGVIDGPLTGGVPKAVELYVVNNIPDLSIFGIGSANNGGGSDGEEFTFPAVAATAGDFIYVASESTGFTDFFGFAPEYTDSAASINGDDAIELFESGVVIDTFGDINVDGSGQPWEYLDGWAYRVTGTEADGTIFNIANWSFSGPNALDGETSNGSAATPFPIGTFMPLAGDAAPSVASTDPANAATGVAIDANITINFSEDVTVTGSWFDISCTVSGSVTAFASGSLASYTLDPDTDFANGENCTVTVFGAQVTDNDTDDPPDTMNGDASFSFDTVSLSTSSLIINEVDADQTGTDNAEFVELYDGGSGNTDLTGHVLVFFNGSDDASYEAFNLDGFSTDADGYFVLCGDAANVANCDLDVTPDTNLIQNGPDAIALYLGDAVNFPNDTPVTTVDLLDAIVYDTNDSDDTGLLPLLNAGQPQVNEDGAGNKDGDSNQRCPNGSGGARNTDTYAQWAPTPGEENICEIVVPPLTCETPDVATPIYTIQGNGPASLLAGTAVVIDGVVVGDFQEGDGDHTDLDGFYVQDPVGDGDPATSDGIYVFAPGAIDVMVGDIVRVSGTVDEFFDLTEITNVDAVLVCGTGGSVAPTSITLPTDFEPYEGMLVTFDQTLYISEFFNFDRFGQIALTTDRQFQPTAVFEPGSVDAAALADANAANRITLDDGRTSQNPDPAIHPNGAIFDLTNTFRGGDSVDDVTGVIDYRFGTYVVQPTQGATYTSLNPRTAAPDPVGGSLSVASFNVLNYFNGDGMGGGFPTPRGADDLDEFNRQRDKIIAALVAIDADVVGLMEIENDGYDSLSAIADLVNGLNDATTPGTYAFIDPGVPQIGTDEIAVGLIYNTTTVTPYGDSAILDSSVDSRFNDERNRPALAQSFVENSSNGIFTVVVNHLKSKGSACDDLGDPDLGDGAGNCNITRLLAAEAMVDWLATDPTGSGDADILIIGDLNSYDKEDPIDAILAGSDDTLGTSDDYSDLVFVYGGEFAYSYVFSGALGYLDYALANNALANQVTGTTVWHINSDEPDILDYDTSFKQDAQDALYEPNAYRASDHDPIIVGLDLTSDFIRNGDGCYVVALEDSPFEGLATEVMVGDTGYNGIRFHSGRWGRAQGFGNSTCYEVHGTNNNEIITGGLTDDLIFGYDGNDFLIGLFGDDTFVGGAGSDFINGGPGLDEILDYEPGLDFLVNVELGY
ncbi:MAG: hypothetical protein DHS20C20_00360 [Ardenticatenaceae bacterium]|nr:MAG: hypothetical protein DHS20C20_00360 [Ardenticatenaceae bacterium]